MPVLLPISGWDTGTHPRLQDWLADRIEQDYPALKAPQLGPGAAAALAHGGHILPILDGLDEVSKAHRARLVAALNSSLTHRDQLILTSRKAEFGAAVNQVGRPLTAAAVIVPKALSRQDIANYLRDCLSGAPSSPWEQVFNALVRGSAAGLARVAATPWVCGSSAPSMSIPKLTQAR